MCSCGRRTSIAYHRTPHPFFSSCAALHASFHSSRFFDCYICSTLARSCSIAIPACSMATMIATRSTSPLSFRHADERLHMRTLPMPSNAMRSVTSTLARDACSPYKSCMSTPSRNVPFGIRLCRPVFCSSGTIFSWLAFVAFCCYIRFVLVFGLRFFLLSTIRQLPLESTDMSLSEVSP